MTYVVYNIQSTLLLTRKEYKTEAAAKAAMTRAKVNPNMYEVAAAGEFHLHIEKREQRTNLMTGTKFWARVNDNRACDPSSETYWCS
jgi:hypothetical protein